MRRNHGVLFFCVALVAAILVGGWIGKPDQSESAAGEHVARHMGWAGPNAVRDARPIVEALPEFRIVGGFVQDNTRKNVRLYEAIEKASGKPLPNIPQETGDCVSWGYRRAVATVLAVGILTGDVQGEFTDFFPPYIYGHSRVIEGHGKIDGAGSLGAWAQETVKKGILPWTSDLRYSGRLADQWGNSGPPRDALDEASQFRIKTTALVDTAAKVRDAICNGYAVAECSQFGTRSFDKKHGRNVARGDDSWGHCMAVDAYDGSNWPDAYFHFFNSWGEDAHPAPLDSTEPRGGFWVTWDQMEEIASQGDTFALSNFDGFPAREIDFTIIARSEVLYDWLDRGRPADRPGLDGGSARTVRGIDGWFATVAGGDGASLRGADLRDDDRPGGHRADRLAGAGRAGDVQGVAAGLQRGAFRHPGSVARGLRIAEADAPNPLLLRGLVRALPVDGSGARQDGEGGGDRREVAILRPTAGRLHEPQFGIDEIRQPVHQAERGGVELALVSDRGPGGPGAKPDAGDGARRLGHANRGELLQTDHGWRPDRVVEPNEGFSPDREWQRSEELRQAIFVDRIVEGLLDGFGHLFAAAWDRLIIAAAKLGLVAGVGAAIPLLIRDAIVGLTGAGIRSLAGRLRQNPR